VHPSRHKTQLGAALVMSAALVVMSAGTAFAHEARDVGQFKVEVGWANEPAYTGDPNAIQFILNDANDQPITDLGDTLKVEASFGDKKSGPLDIKPAFSDEEGAKGDYRADLIPTRPGKYTFHFTGTIHGQPFDESFTSSDTGFDEATDDAEVAFPAKDPSRGELAQKIDRIDPRLVAAQKQAAASKKDADDAKSSATTATVIGIVAIVVAVVLGALAFMGARRRGAGAA
jgi:hypothetical protein